MLREAHAPKRDEEFDEVEEAWAYVSEAFEEPVPDWAIPREIARLLDFELNHLIQQYEKGRIEDVAEMEPLF